MQVGTRGGHGLVVLLLVLVVLVLVVLVVVLVLDLCPQQLLFRCVFFTVLGFKIFLSVTCGRL